MSTYSKNEILEEIQDMVNFYKRKVVNYREKHQIQKITILKL